MNLFTMKFFWQFWVHAYREETHKKIMLIRFKMFEIIVSTLEILINDEKNGSIFQSKINDF